MSQISFYGKIGVELKRRERKKRKKGKKRKRRERGRKKREEEREERKREKKREGEGLQMRPELEPVMSLLLTESMQYTFSSSCLKMEPTNSPPSSHIPISLSFAAEQKYLFSFFSSFFL